ncbi:hypothetical protein [Bosea beijingensis]|uniref:hypothetical protein n=1 Tax=Bosea beijingensis TaxID=3068632 RepID=UPI002741190C|nr:hypothetical protein [Bosea sp. REN20]
MNFKIIAAFALLGVSPALADEFLTIHPKMPYAAIYAKGGYNGENAFARARIGRAEMKEWCENWRPGDRACVKDFGPGFENKEIAISADCSKGSLTVDARRYQADGVWAGGDGHGRVKFRSTAGGEIVGTDNASGGLTLAVQFETLCPLGLGGVKPVSHEKMVLGEDDYSGMQSVWDHNGSLVHVDGGTGIIAYDEPKAALKGTVAPRAILFRGTIEQGGRIEGTAYAFKKGCAPAPYKVSGRYSASRDQIVLKGDGPTRNGCEVSGYSARSPHSTLKFRSMMSD